ncbi:MAG TPA: PIN domain-containing protein [Roseiarcus sp.]|nr:PIN domain-containing protein [Roseiarcus sp.]
MTSFFDTNIFVYAFLDVPKQDAARAALADGGAISAQVLNEFVNVMRRKHQRSWRDVENALAVILDRFPDVAPLTLATNADAVALARDHGLAFYDALIVAAALEAGCARLYSEDFQHGRRFGDLAIVDPFKESAAG